jgi:hypothetical protein
LVLSRKPQFGACSISCPIFGLQQGALAPSGTSMLSSWLRIVGCRRGSARWLVAIAGVVFAVDHFGIACSGFRSVRRLGGEVKSVVVRSHGKVKSLINIPFDAVLYYRFDAHDRVDFSDLVVWPGIKKKERLLTYRARSFCLSVVPAFSNLCSFQVGGRGFRVCAQGQDICK